MRQARAEALGEKAHVTVLLVDQAGFGAAPSHPEQARFDDKQLAWRVSRPFPKAFRAVGLDLQTKREQRQGIHRPKKCPQWCPACKRINQKQLQRNDSVWQASGLANG